MEIQLSKIEFIEKSASLEDFLATDDLFVEYFNTYLALPSFPEPLCFNPETGGFEVVSEARLELAQKIKAAVRSQQKAAPVYRVTRHHSFVDLPLIPIVEPEGPEKMEIDTSFNVTTLNKDQGIYWVKAERLPSFLKSDCYFEYRLAQVLSQVRLHDPKGRFVVTKVDFTPRPRKVKKKQEEVKVNLKEVYIKNMYVCMGQASTTATDSWFSLAKMAHTTDPTYVSLSRPVSASRPAQYSPHGYSLTARPASAVTRSSRVRPDSGVSSMGSLHRSSVFASPYFGSYDSVDDVTNPRASFVNSGSSRKPITPRPGDPVCVTSDDDHSIFASQVVYAYPRAKSTDTESGVGDVSEMDSELEADVQQASEAYSRSSYGPPVDAGPSDLAETESTGPAAVSGSGSDQSVVVDSVDTLCALIVAVVMKKALADLARMDQEALLAKDPRVTKFFPDSAYAHISTDMLDNVMAVVPARTRENGQEKKAERLDLTTAATVTRDDAVGSNSSSSSRQSKDGNESDVDSLLDSEEDYEEEDLQFFRRHRKQRSYSLATRKGVQRFKKFLRGTAGESLWLLWMDIDKLPLLVTDDDRALYLSGMREKYHKPGAPYEIATEFKSTLGLSEPSQWTVEKLQKVQPRVAEPLVSYWAPRFLLRELLRTNPSKYREYTEQRLSLLPLREVYPNPPTMNLLPLRPKSCYPRVYQQPRPLTIENMWEQEVVEETGLETTTPRVGLRRVYGPPAIKIPHLPGVAASTPSPVPPTQTPRTVAATKKPKELLIAHLKANDELDKLERIGSSVSRSQSKVSSAKSRPKSAKPQGRAGRRPVSAESGSSGSWDNGSDTAVEKQPSPGLPLSDTTRPLSGAGKTIVAEAGRISSAKSTGSSASSGSTQFQGGRRMEALLQALYHEKDSGHFFRSFLKKSDNRKWLDSAQFWEDVQEYRQLFYQDTIDPFIIKKHAQAIYSKYIVSGAPRSIGCPTQVRQQVFECLIPPQEELFDQPEEEALKILYAAWMEGLSSDLQAYSKVELIEVKRHLETKSKYVLKLQRSGLIKERTLTPDEPMEGYEDPVYDPASWEAVPEEFREYSLEKLVHNRLELEHFKQFLAEKYADTDLKCWMDVEAWRRILPAEERKRDQKSKDIKKSYLNKKYFFGPNSPAGKEGQDKVMQAGGGWGKLLEDRPPTAVLLEAQKYVRDRLEKKWLPLFLVTEAFAERQRPKTAMDDVVDDVLVQKRRRSQAVWKMLESRWVSSSKEILTFRKALLNPVTSHQFRRFVSIKGDNLENDVLFWQEVQKYKQMHHVHTEDSLLSQKITAIINCFIDSHIPPSLQIDLPQEMAERILDRKYEKSPYLFRESQLAVFRILFTHWNDFCELRTNLGQDKVLPTIERLRRHAKARERSRQAELDKKAEGDRPDDEMDTLRAESPFQDPFGDQESQEDDESCRKEKIEFSYASYMRELNKEELLNNTDDSLFSSLQDLTGVLFKGDIWAKETQLTEQSRSNGSQGSERRPSQDDGTQSSDKKKPSKSEHTQTPQTQPRRKSLKKELAQQELPPSSGGDPTCDKRDAKGESHSKPRLTMVDNRPTSGRHRSTRAAATVTLHETHAHELKLSRHIPPLVHKR